MSPRHPGDITNSQWMALGALIRHGPTQHHVLAVRLGYTSDQPLRPIMSALLRLRLVSKTDTPAKDGPPFSRIWAAR